MTTNRTVVFTKSAPAAIGTLGAGLKNDGRFHGPACSSSDQRSAELTAWLRCDRRAPLERDQFAAPETIRLNPLRALAVAKTSLVLAFARIGFPPCDPLCDFSRPAKGLGRARYSDGLLREGTFRRGEPPPPR